MADEGSSFIVTVASGKGGTGKTTVATTLATTAPIPALYADCDVEEPNGRLLLSPTIEKQAPFEALLPQVDTERCTSCGMCQEVCLFNAILVLDHPVLFAEECHSCGACVELCPERAISEKPVRRGQLSFGRSNGLRFVEGRLDVGQAAASPLVRAVRAAASDLSGVVVVDASPGVSCPVVEASKGADVLLLVTEPTPLGAHDLGLALTLAATLGVPARIVLNRSGSGDDTIIERMADKHGAPILARIPFDRGIAEAYAHGRLPTHARADIEALFLGLWDTLLEGRLS